jgi:hypothetical protein
LVLTKSRPTDHSGGFQHLMGGLKHPLEMGREPLNQGKLFPEPIQADPPCHHVFGAGDLDQAIQASSDG